MIRNPSAAVLSVFPAGADAWTLQLFFEGSNSNGASRVVQPSDGVLGAVDDFWKFVDDSSDELICIPPADRLVDDFVCLAARIADTLLGADLCTELCNLRQAGARRLLISSQVESDVPWEVLCVEDAGGTRVLLSDMFGVIRLPPAQFAERRKLQPNSESRKLLGAVVDGTLLDQFESEGLRGVLESLKQSFGDDFLLCPCSRASDLPLAATSVKLLVYLGHHEAGVGLRLGKNVFFGPDQASVFRFPSSSGVLLLSCRSGAGDGRSGGLCAAGKRRSSIAAHISSVSLCSVAGFLPDLPMKAAVDALACISECLGSSAEMRRDCDLKAVLAKSLGKLRSPFYRLVGVYGRVFRFPVFGIDLGVK